MLEEHERLWSDYEKLLLAYQSLQTARLGAREWTSEEFPISAFVEDLHFGGLGFKDDRSTSIVYGPARKECGGDDSWALWGSACVINNCDDRTVSQ